MALTEDAKAAFAEAFEIVKRDKLYAMIRKATAAGQTPPAPPAPPAPGAGAPGAPPAPTPTPPPPGAPKDPGNQPKRSAYWGITEETD